MEYAAVSVVQGADYMVMFPIHTNGGTSAEFVLKMGTSVPPFANLPTGARIGAVRDSLGVSPVVVSAVFRAPVTGTVYLAVAPSSTVTPRAAETADALLPANQARILRLP